MVQKIPLMEQAPSFEEGSLLTYHPTAAILI